MKPKRSRREKSLKEEATHPSPEDFIFSLTRIAVSQICQSVGFKSAQQSALETLSHVAAVFLQTLARSASSFSRASNRTQSNLLDLINALHDLSSVQGFLGASTLHSDTNCLLNSTVLKELSSFVNSTDEIPFAKPIPRNNVPNNSIMVPHKEYSETNTMMHIPNWLPEFPNPSTLKRGDHMGNGRRKGRDTLWEDSILVQNGGDCGRNWRENEGKSGELPMVRERVGFKIGLGRGNGVELGMMNMKNGVCRLGKRVCWSVDDRSRIDEDEDKKRVEEDMILADD